MFSLAVDTGFQGSTVAEPLADDRYNVVINTN